MICRYPTDSDKHMLASQTGLTRNQVKIYVFYKTKKERDFIGSVFMSLHT